MPEHVAARAAEPFFTTKPTGKGTGLGLAMASGFVQQSRGRLEIDSAPGKGTTIRMLFPVAGADALPTVHTAGHPVGESAKVDGAHILLVEDSPDVLALAQEHLVEAGYRVTAVENGDLALVEWERIRATDPIDLLFTDLVMPGTLNGIALAEAITAQDRDMPVLMTTGYNEELVAEGPLRRGLDVLGKPWRKAELLDRVAQALAKRAAGQARRIPSEFGAAEE